MNEPPVVVLLGIGNILLTDEGAGVHAINMLMEKYTFPENVELYDGGVTGMAGLLPIIEDADHLVILDAANGPDEPGTVRRYNLDDFRLTVPKKLSSHDIGLIDCLSVAETIGKSPESVTIIGIQPENITTYAMTPSPTIAKNLEKMVTMVIDELCALGVTPLSVTI